MATAKTATKKAANTAAAKPAAVKVVAVMPKLFDSVAKIDAAIASIAKRGKKLDDDIQLCGLSVLAHIDKHGDITLANKLYVCMPKGSRRRALAEWLLNFGKLAANTDRTTSTSAPFIYARDKTTKLEAALNEPWYTFAPEPEVADMFDVEAALHALINRAKKAKQVNNIELLARIQQLDDTVQTQHAANPAQAAATQH